MNVLLVEDDKQVGDFIVSELLATGHTCTHAQDGEAGFLAASNSMFDVMVIDRMMPRMDGLTLINTLRASGDNTPVLVLSALGDVTDRVQGLQCGADDYLVKPFAKTERLARLEVLGLPTNRAFLIECLGDEVFRRGDEQIVAPAQFRHLNRGKVNKAMRQYFGVDVQK